MSKHHPLAFEERYKVGDQLWLDGPHGGWSATDRILERDIILHQPYRSEDYERFLDMVRIRAKYRHTALIPVYDFGFRNDGRPYFTEPLIPAVDFQSVLMDDAVSLHRVVEYLLMVSSAVSLLHENGQAGLELHPHRILVSVKTREAFLWWLNPVRPASLPILYMPPEHTRSPRTDKPDPSGDVYALGGMLYEALNGHPPNMMKDANSHLAICAELANRKGPPSPGIPSKRSIQSPDLARRLESLCLSAMESEPANRLSNATVFFTELERCLTGQQG